MFYKHIKAREINNLNLRKFMINNYKLYKHLKFNSTTVPHKIKLIIRYKLNTL